ncbi:MAG: CHAT domain-containing protein [Blastocatellia bacterium]|nr:CHAT domain-containing protein [Blastocatellia bacterium]
MKRRAIALLKSSAAAEAGSSDVWTELRILSLLGEIESEISAFGDAACHYNHALQHARQQKDSSILADALNAASLAAIRLNQLEEARALGREAMALCETEGYPAGKARAIANEAEWHYASGDRDRALEKYLQAQAIFAGLNQQKQAAEMQMNAGLVHSDKFDADNAFSAFNGALQSFEALNDARGRALTLLGIAHLKARLGESEGALALYDRTLKMIRDQGDRYWEASALNGIGLVYQSSGERKTALAHYEQAREIFRSLGLKSEEAQAMLTAGLILEDRERAVGLFEDLLKLFQELQDRKLEAICWRELGALYAARDDKRATLDAYARALALFETTANPRGKVITLIALSEAQRTFDLRAAAEQTLQTALALSRSSGNTAGERETLYQLARMEKEDGRLDKARTHIESALALAEIERSNAGGQALQASYFASIQSYFHLYIDLLMAPSQKGGGEALRELAFEQSERARARSLLDELTRARADYLRWGDPVLIERLRQIQAEINRSEEERLQKQREDAAEPELTAISLKTTALFIERDQVEARLRDAAPADRASIEPRPAMLRDIQQLLDPDTLLLEYWLGEKRSWVWVITPTSIDSAALPGRAAIEAAAQDFYAILSTAPLQSGLSPEEYEKSYRQKGGALSRMILGPLAHKLTTRRMLLVTDGLLQRIPFQALPAPEMRAPQPLMMRHEIVNLPSASVLVTLRQQRMRRQSPTKSIAVFADAVFEHDDLRFESGSAGHAQIAGSLTQSPPRRSTPPPRRLPRLYFTDEEAKAIESVTTDLAPRIATGFAASRETVLDGRLNDYRILHFATHGDLNDEHPELSALIFSRFDRQRRPQSGYLRVHDIYNLKLSADLVVLSACQTALGKQIRGEGVISLSRGFMYAGSRQVLASLWNVEDNSTALLMKHFYWNLFKLGQPPAEALRHAQMALWQEPRTRAPYFWAGFVLQGEYK